MTDRDGLIHAEQQRKEDVAARRKELLAELEEVSPPVLAFRKAEERMRAIQSQLRQMSEHSSATRGAFGRELERTMPDELREVLNLARAELNARRRSGDEPAESLRRLADLRQWHDDVLAALPDATKSNDDLRQIAAAGRELLSEAVIGRG